MDISRRQFLDLVGRAGGSAAVLQVGLALGLVASASNADVRPIQPLNGRKQSVLILGAGLSGLVVAYELQKAGYDCTIIESSARDGGRCLTLRGGDRVDEIGQSQRCEFDDDPDLYFNAGPSRIPAHHHLVHHYCREFNLPLEPYINENRYAYVQDDAAFDGRPVRIREYVADARGFLSELLAKGLSNAQLDTQFSMQDAERLHAFVQRYGDLDPQGKYRGSSRAGYVSGGTMAPGVRKGPLDFSEILNHGFWQWGMHWGESEDQAAPLMQITGGFDLLVKALVKRIKGPIIYNAPVRDIKLLEDGVAITYQHKGKVKKLQGDFCFNCIPAQLLTGIPANFSSTYDEAVHELGRHSGGLTKVAFQSGQRFWERDDIYGGISWTQQPIEQIQYPSNGFNQEKGVLIGAYSWFPAHNAWFGKLSPEQRLQQTLKQMEKVHPNAGRHIDNGVSVVWHRMNHQLGCGSYLRGDAQTKYLPILQNADGRHFLIGDQVSYHSGWQEGALASAHQAMALMNERVQQASTVRSGLIGGVS